MKCMEEVSGTLKLSMICLGISRSFSALAVASLPSNSFSPLSPRRFFCAATRADSVDLSDCDRL